MQILPALFGAGASATAAAGASVAGAGAAATGTVGALGATASAGAAGTAAAAGGAGLSLSKMLSFGGGILSGLSQLASGFAQAQEAETAAAWEKFGIKSEELKGRAEALDALEAANDAAAAAQAAGFAAGLAGEGSITRAKEKAIEDGDFEIGMAKDNAAIRMSRRRSNVRILKSRASGARLTGVFGALDSGLSTYYDFKGTG